MGYRHYFMKIAKEKSNAIRDLSIDDLFDNYTTDKHKQEFEQELEDNPDTSKYVNIHELVDGMVFEFGKLYWDDTADRIYATGEPYFTNEETQESMEHYHPYLMNRESIKTAIKIYEEKVINAYTELFKDNNDDKVIIDKTKTIDDIPKEVLIKCVQNCRDMLKEWEHHRITTCLDTSNYLTMSWYYEYSIFNLIYLYKTFDFEKYDLLFYGW